MNSKHARLPGIVLLVLLLIGIPVVWRVARTGVVATVFLATESSAQTLSTRGLTLLAGVASAIAAISVLVLGSMLSLRVLKPGLPRRPAGLLLSVMLCIAGATFIFAAGAGDWFSRLSALGLAVVCLVSVFLPLVPTDP